MRRSCLVLVLSLLMLSFSNVYGDFSGEFRSPLSPGVGYHGVLGNPWLLTSIQKPSKMLLIPTPFSFFGQIGNNQFVLPDVTELITFQSDMGSWCARLLIESFDVQGETPEQVSQSITRQLKNGIDIQTGVSVPVLAFVKLDTIGKLFSGYGFSASVNTRTLGHIPGEPLAILFSPEHGLQPGNVIPIGNFFLEANVSTDIRGSIGSRSHLSFVLPLLGDASLTWGVSGTYRLGHSLFRISLDSGAIDFKKDNQLSIKGAGRVLTTGTGFYGQYRLGSPLADGLPVVGHGVGVNAGVGLLSSHASVALSIRDFGYIWWGSRLKESMLHLEGDSLSVWGIMAQNKGVSLNASSLQNTKEGLYEPFATDIGLHSSYRWNNDAGTKWWIPYCSNYRLLSLYYLQPIIRSNGLRLMPRVGGMVENGLWKGMFPVRAGIEFGGWEQSSSFTEIDCVSPGASFAFWYRALGSPYFVSKRGMEGGVMIHLFWDSLDKWRNMPYRI